MYVVTSILLVNRARATLRNAELGFLGVCVYTRMQTPRFSGHDWSAGDFVLVLIFSRPFRTNCANVGTALLQSRTSRFRPTSAQADTWIVVAGQQKRSTCDRANRQESPDKNPAERA